MDNTSTYDVETSYRDGDGVWHTTREARFLPLDGALHVAARIAATGNFDNVHVINADGVRIVTY